MFDPQDQPRVFGMAPGVDFGAALIAGLADRLDSDDPTAWSRVEIYVNTARMQRRLRSIFDAGPPRLLPRVRLVTDLAGDPSATAVPPPVSPLRRRLQLSQAVSLLLDRDETLAPRAALYDLSDSLANLMDEMHGEGVRIDAIDGLDIADQSGHWQRAKTFLQLLRPYTDTLGDAPDREARQRLVIEALVDRWESAPPTHPIIVAGSTASRGATGLLMQAVARLPQGAVVLPGFDFDMPTEVWDTLDAPGTPHDHPQMNLAKFLHALGIAPQTVPDWSAPPPDAARNRLVSLSLRPAPVTDQWLRDGPDLGDLTAATKDLTLIEAPSPRAEAEAIALGLRQAIDRGITAALITPDRMLTRQVAAALDRWNINPDDSAGIPLALSAPGRLLRQVADLLGQTVTGEALLSLLKHPLCATGGEDRGDHLRLTRDLELRLRRYGPPLLDAKALSDWAHDKTDRQPWAAWIGDILNLISDEAEKPLTDHVAIHLEATERLCAGPDTTGAGELWDKAAGREARRVTDMLRRDADAGGEMSCFDYATLAAGVIGSGSVRERDANHPQVLIWGTLEARVQGADLVILGGLNEGVWPQMPSPDPWLNRAMRAQIGLLLPDRQIALSAHDYQQAIAAKEVWITRATRSSEAETVPSRWVNRLVNLMAGLPDQNGPGALDKMREKGAKVLAQAATLSDAGRSLPRADRPSPAPPVSARPTRLSVTQIKTLVRDPYAIYAKKVLRLNPLDPLKATSDPALKGEVFHKILELFIESDPPLDDAGGRAALLTVATDVLADRCPWPLVRLHWLTQIESLSGAFLEGERSRREKAVPRILEASGSTAMEGADLTLTARADRIDIAPDGRALIYDYKTGVMPTVKNQPTFDKQLLLMAGMVERGAFDNLPATPVTEAAFIGVKADSKVVPAPLGDHPAATVWEDTRRWLIAWRDPARGYTARRAMLSVTDRSDYDHLSRRDEWSATQDGTKVILT